MSSDVCKNEFGHGAMHRAVILNDEKTLKILIASGHDTAEKDSMGFTPIELATILQKENLLSYFENVRKEVNHSSSSDDLFRPEVRRHSSLSHLSALRARVSSILEKRRRRSSRKPSSEFSQGERDEEKYFLESNSNTKWKNNKSIPRHINNISRDCSHQKQVCDLQLEERSRKERNDQSIVYENNFYKEFNKNDETIKKEIDNNLDLSRDLSTIRHLAGNSFQNNACCLSPTTENREENKLAPFSVNLCICVKEMNYRQTTGKQCIPGISRLNDCFIDINDNVYKIVSYGCEEYDTSKHTIHVRHSKQAERKLSLSGKEFHSSGLTRGSKCNSKQHRSLCKQNNLTKQNTRLIFSFDEQDNCNVNSKLTFDDEDKSFCDALLDQNKHCGCTRLPLKRSLSWPLIFSECNRVSIMDEWEVWDMNDEETDSTKLSEDSTSGKELLEDEESPLVNRCVSVRTSFNGGSNVDIHKSFNSDDSQLLEEVKTVYVFKGSNNNRSSENLTKSCDLSAPSKKQSFRDAFRERLSVNFGSSMFSKSKSMESLRSIRETNDDHMPKSVRNLSTTHSDLTALHREEEMDNELINDVFHSSSDENLHQDSIDTKTQHRGNLILNVPGSSRARSLTDTTSKSSEDVYVLTAPTLSRAQSAEEITRASSVGRNMSTNIQNHRPLSKTHSDGYSSSGATRKTLGGLDKPQKKKSLDNSTIQTRDSGYFSLDETRKHSLENDSSANLSYKIVFTPEQSNNEEDAKKSKNEKSKQGLFTPTQPNQSLTSLQQGLLPLIAIGLGEKKESDHVINSVTSPHSVEEHGNFHLDVQHNNGRGKRVSVSEEDEYVDINFSVDDVEEENESSLDGFQELEQSSADNNKNFDDDHEQPSFNSLDSSTPVKNKQSLSCDHSTDADDGDGGVTKLLKEGDIPVDIPHEKLVSDNNYIEITESPGNDSHSGSLIENQQPVLCINGVIVQESNETDSNSKTLSGYVDGGEDGTAEDHSFKMVQPLENISDSSTEAFDSMDSLDTARKTSLETSLSLFEDSLRSFEAHEHEFLVNGDDSLRPELSTEEEFESMYRDALDDDSIDFKRGNAGGYLPTISEISTEAENRGFEDESDEDDIALEDGYTTGEDEENVRALSAENLRLHDQEVQEDRKSLKDELLEDYINIEFELGDDDKQGDSEVAKETLVEDLEGSKNEELSNNGDKEVSSQNMDELPNSSTSDCTTSFNNVAQLDLSDDQDILIEASQQEIHVENIRGALIVTENWVHHATVNTHDNAHEKPTVFDTNTTDNCSRVVDDDDSSTKIQNENNLQCGGLDTPNDKAEGQKEEMDFTTKYSLTMHDENTSINSDAGYRPDEELQMISADECIISTDQSREAVIHGNQSDIPIENEDGVTMSNQHITNKDNDTDDKCIHDVDDIEKSQRVNQNKCVANDDGSIVIEDSEQSEIIHLIPEETDDEHAENHDNDELTELPSPRNYPSLKHHLPRQQTIDNAMKSNEVRKQNASLTRDPSLAWDDFQTSYNDDDGYYVDNNDSDCGEDANGHRLDDDTRQIDAEVTILNFKNSNILSDEIRKDENITDTMIDDSMKEETAVNERETNTDKVETDIKCRDYDSASDKATEMYESVENESISSEGELYPIHPLTFSHVNTEQNDNHKHRVESSLKNPPIDENKSDTEMSENPGTKELQDLNDNSIPSLVKILNHSRNRKECMQYLKRHLFHPNTYTELYIHLSDTPSNADLSMSESLLDRIELANKLYYTIEEYDLCSFSLVINELLCHLGVLKSEKLVKENVDIPKLLNFLKLFIENCNLKLYHIQTFAYLIAKPSWRLSEHKTLRVSVLSACFHQEMNSMQQQSQTLDRITTAFRKICEYLFHVDVELSKNLLRKYVVPYITDQLSTKFVINIVQYMGLLKSEQPVPTTDNATPSLLLLSIIVDSDSNTLSQESRRVLRAFLGRSSKVFRFCSKHKNNLYEKLV